MISHIHHHVSEQLKDRHPYLQEEFPKEVDPEEVAQAFENRSVTKLAALLVQNPLSNEKRKLALQLLVSISSHQERKCEVIQADCIEYASELLSSDEPLVRFEAATLIGSLALNMSGRSRLASCPAVEKLAGALSDDAIAVQQAASESLKNISMFRDGSVFLTVPEIESHIIDCTKKYIPLSRFAALVPGHVLLNCLEALCNLTRYSAGHRPALQANLVKSISVLLHDHISNHPLAVKIQTSAFNTLWNLCTNDEAREQSIDSNCIQVAAKFLLHLDAGIRRCAVGYLMSVTINLRGKELAIEHAVPTVASLLEDTEEEIRTNSKITLHNVAENENGRLVSVRCLCHSIPFLEEVFGISSVKPLALLLTDSDRIIVRCATKAIAHFIKNHKGGLDQARDCVNIGPKLLKCVRESSGEDLSAVESLEAILKVDVWNKQICQEAYAQFDSKGRRAISGHPELLALVRAHQ
eukprot:GILI01013562.1.p1 GENE.GILI01013562.1~~GILI01013562.1.p1  ORF type:complete len:468 (-),score=71.55 GILI01013562.1:31-1434(-)